MFELNQLYQLISVADCGTITKASEELLISQPALSRSMQKLEDEIGVKLFDRYKNKIELNENGRTAVEYARKVTKEAEEMVDKLQEYDKIHRTISICTCAPAPLWDIVPAIAKLYPNMKITHDMNYNSKTIIDDLLNEKYTIAIAPNEIQKDGIVCKKYITENLYFSAPKNHRLAGMKSVTFDDINGETMLLFNDIGVWMHIRDKTPDTKYIVQDKRSDMMTLVNMSMLPCYATDIVTENEGGNPNRVYIPIDDPDAHITYYIIYRKKERKRLKALIDYINNI